MPTEPETETKSVLGLSLCLAQRQISQECLIRFNWNIPYLVRNKLWIPLASLSSLCIGTTPTRCLGAMGIWHSLLFHTAQTTAHRELLGMNGKLTKEKPARRTRRHRDWGDEEEMLKGNNTQKKNKKMKKVSLSCLIRHNTQAARESSTYIISKTATRHLTQEEEKKLLFSVLCYCFYCHAPLFVSRGGVWPVVERSREWDENLFVLLFFR